MPDLSLDDIRGRLNTLLNTGDQHDRWVRDYYTDHVIYTEDSTGRLYRQAYAVTDDDVTIEGDAIEVHVVYEPIRAS